MMDEQAIDNTEVHNPEGEKQEDEIENEEQVKSNENIKEKKRSKDERGRRNDKKSAEHCLKTLNDTQTLEEKLDIVCRKYSEIFDENRRLQLTVKQAEKRIAMLQREKDQFQSERSRAVLTRKRLENLCRELQKQNKAVKEESLLKIREEEEKRKEVSAKFQSTLAEITALMNQNIEKNTKMQEDNIEMNKKFKSVYEQVELKEQQLRKVHQQMKLDVQLAHAKLAKVKMEATAEKEALLKEKHQLLFKLTEYQVQIRELQATEIALRSQISMYTDKYDEFQNALTRSNKVYGEFNEEMAKMSKKIMTLEKETSLWKQRWENSHVALLEMAADKQIRDTEMATLSKKLSLLQDLCKMFQRERTNLLAQLKEKNGTNQSETNVPDESQNNKTLNQVDALTDDCLQLENNLGQLQDSLSKISESLKDASTPETALKVSDQSNSNKIDNDVAGESNGEMKNTENEESPNMNPNEEENTNVDKKTEESPEISENEVEATGERVNVVVKDDDTINETPTVEEENSLKKQVDADVLNVIQSIAELVEQVEDMKEQTENIDKQIKETHSQEESGESNEIVNTEIPEEKVLETINEDTSMVLKDPTRHHHDSKMPGSVVEIQSTAESLEKEVYTPSVETVVDCTNGTKFPSKEMDYEKADVKSPDPVPVKHGKKKRK